ncbi:hypothetical protein SDC9_171453 [bioreactor metagenome]|uniref:Uncharacterized protein n=1 Tax=bioreactor metagenome TaxID=1076179 RepID=A0A645GE58_9ZZZZ
MGAAVDDRRVIEIEGYFGKVVGEKEYEEGVGEPGKVEGCECVAQPDVLNHQERRKHSCFKGDHHGEHNHKEGKPATWKIEQREGKGRHRAQQDRA